MDLLVFLLIGLIAGALPKALKPGSRKEPAGWFMVMLLGVAGAYLGGFVGRIVGIRADNLFMSLLTATPGAVILIAVLRLPSSRGSQPAA